MTGGRWVREVDNADIGVEAAKHFSQLVEIHAARPWLWPALVEAMLYRTCGTVDESLGFCRSHDAHPINICGRV